MQSGYIFIGVDMRKTVILCMLLLMGSNLFSGSFFVNHLVIDSEKSQVEEYLDSINLGIIGLYDKNQPNHYLI